MKGGLILVVPRRHGAYRQQRDKQQDDESSGFVVMRIAMYDTRVWRELVPSIERASSKELVKQNLWIKQNLKHYKWQLTKDDHNTNSTINIIYRTMVVEKKQDAIDGSLKGEPSLSVNDSGLLLYIEPNFNYTFSDGWTGRLLFWENALIRAQSLAGYYATLGGGYFLCHHWQTAIVLAKQQQQMALVFGDWRMALKCILNQAYNYIYAGKFKLAQECILHVYHEGQTDSILVNMCKSANHLAQRMQQWHRQEKQQRKSGSDKGYNETTYSKLVDNFARIRIMNDKSSLRDRLIV